MNQSATAPDNVARTDADTGVHVRPGHGIPSQDPSAAAQFPRDPEDTERETRTVLVAGGAAAGVTTGAVIGVMVAGPVGAAVGATMGAVAGALGGSAAGAMVDPDTAAKPPVQ